MNKVNASSPDCFSRFITASRLLFVLQIAEAGQFPDWVFERKLTASEEGDGDEFGRAVAVSGDMAMVAAKSEDGDGINRGRLND